MSHVVWYNLSKKIEMIYDGKSLRLLMH